MRKFARLVISNRLPALHPWRLTDGGPRAEDRGRKKQVNCTSGIRFPSSGIRKGLPFFGIFKDTLEKSGDCIDESQRDPKSLSRLFQRAWTCDCEKLFGNSSRRPHPSFYQRGHGAVQEDFPGRGKAAIFSCN